MKKKLQTALAAIAFMVIGHNVSAQTEVTYDFDSVTPSVGVAPASPSTLQYVAGTATVPALIGNSTNVLQPLAYGNSNTSVADLTSIPIASDYSVTWKEYVSTNIQLKKGVLLRGNGVSGYTTGTTTPIVFPGLKKGYYFMVQNNLNSTVGAVGTVTFRIFKVSELTTLTQLNPSTSAKTIVGLAQNTACWFRASVTGSTLKFEYSIDGVTFLVGDTVTDATYSSGSTQLFYGLGISSKLYYFDDIKFSSNDSTTWNGTAWDKGVPVSSSNAIINGNYSEAINLVAGALNVTGTAVASVPTGYRFTVAGAVSVDPTASLTIENNANLIQAGTTNTNMGNVVVKRNSSALSRLDYTLWSSPVAGQIWQLFLL